MTRHFYTDEIEVTVDQIVAVITEQLSEQTYSQADSLRTAAMYLPLTMTPAQWVAGARKCNVNEGTARNRLNEVRRFQREIGEIK